MSESKRTILIQLDTDAHPSVFDRVVAVDAGAQEVFAYGAVTPESVVGLVHGAIFTRGGDDLQRTAIFIGGSNVAKGEALLDAVRGAFFGPMRVSVLLDANGANTTAAAAVLSAAKHLPLAETTALVLGGTGPVGQRAAGLLARQGARVRLASRSMERASQAASAVNQAIAQSEDNGASGTVEPCAPADDGALAQALDGAALVIAAGAAGVRLLPADIRRRAGALKVMIDLNAVPPAGIEGVEMTDKATDRDGITAYGPIGVGGLKMKIHKAAIRQLFERHDQVLDAQEVYAIGEAIVGNA